MPRLHPWLVRFLGVSALSFVSLFVFFKWVGNYNVGWALPWTKPFRLAWPTLPRFGAWTQTNAEGQSETYLQVPTRKLTKAEIAQMYYTPPAATNAATSATTPASGR